MPYDPHRHHRRSIRLPGYDYTAEGVYFVTICAAGRQQIFGHIACRQVVLSSIGRVVERCWQYIPLHSAHVTLDAFVVMPEHMHGLIVITQQAIERDRTAHLPNGTTPGSLATIIQSFKSISSRYANRLRHTPATPLWQRNYYERIVRGEVALHAIRRYINTNPAR